MFRRWGIGTAIRGAAHAHHVPRERGDEPGIDLARFSFCPIFDPEALDP